MTEITTPHLKDLLLQDKRITEVLSFDGGCLLGISYLKLSLKADVIFAFLVCDIPAALL